jgi:prepilin-type N-terminal cleavage/methylation domain-containing protein
MEPNFCRHQKCSLQDKIAGSSLSKDHIKKSMNKRKGFSLIELAASIVIIALIFAAITSGLSQMSQAELRSVTADMQNYRSMYDSFYAQYKQVPGDMLTADLVWTGASCTAGPVCNGNGNGVIQAIHGSSLDETLRAWLHLRLSGIYESNIVVIPAAYTGVITIGDMTPKSKINGTGYYMAGGTDIGGDTGGTIIPSPWTDLRTNAVFLGKKSSSTTSNGLTIGALTGKDAFNIDRKIDDGTVDSAGNSTGFNSGKFRARNDSAGGTTCVNGGNTSYVLSSAAATCLTGYQLNDINF